MDCFKIEEIAIAGARTSDASWRRATAHSSQSGDRPSRKVIEHSIDVCNSLLVGLYPIARPAPGPYPGSSSTYRNLLTER
jgi:hypothetical protein